MTTIRMAHFWLPRSRFATASEGLDADGHRGAGQCEPGLLVASPQGHGLTEPPRRRLACSGRFEHLGCRDHPLRAELGQIAETRCLIHGVADHRVLEPL